MPIERIKERIKRESRPTLKTKPTEINSTCTISACHLSYICVVFQWCLICLVILFGISSGDKNRVKKSCWLNNKKSRNLCPDSCGPELADYFHQKDPFFNQLLLFKYLPTQWFCSLVVFRHILQLHYVHGGLKRCHNHHDSQLSPSFGRHSWDAKLGEFNS